MWVEGRTDESEIVFLTLRLIDEATLFSKKEVLEEYEKNKESKDLEKLLYKKAIYPNRESLGFYNTSKFTLADFFEKDLAEEDFTEYLNSFSYEVQELFKILKPNFYDIDEKRYLKRNIFSENFSENKEGILDLFLINIFHFNPYLNYEEYSNLMINILFDKINFEENVSILHINPDTPLIFECLKQIKKETSECNVNLYAITSNSRVAFMLKFLSIIYKANFNFILDDGLEVNENKDYNKLFKLNKKFDFIIQEDADKDFQSRIPENKLLSNYDITISSRVLYIVPFGNHFFKSDWFGRDLLESLIVIPIKHDRYKKPTQVRRYMLMTLIVLNYNKINERKNKCLVIDHNENKDNSTIEYDVEEYENIINSNQIYIKSFDQFSIFDERNTGKIIKNDEIYETNKNCIRMLSDEKRRKFMSDEFIETNINDILYPVKMNSQKNYYQIESFDHDSTEKRYRTIEKLDYEVEELGNLIKRVHHRKKDGEFVNTKNHLYFSGSRYIENKWVYFDFEIKNHILYFKMVPISDKVSLEYLYYYLNSQLGINEHDYFIRGYRPRWSNYYEKIRVVIPPKDVQNKIVESMNKKEGFLREVEEVGTRINEDFFNYEKHLDIIDKYYDDRKISEDGQEISIADNLEYTLSGLVWPLAVTYLIATSGGFEKTEKANNLLRLFEFTTAFNTIVLMSGLPNEIYEQNKMKIWDYFYVKTKKGKKSPKKIKLGFGNWVELSNILSNIYNKQTFNTELNKDFYFNLLSKKIRGHYSDLKEERNREFHSGISNPYEAEILINELEPVKSEIFKELTSWYRNFKLYYTTGRLDKRTNEYEVIFLNGAYTMPIYDTVVYDGDLDAESIYLHDTKNNIFSKLNDNLIKFKAVDKTKHDWRLYIFIGYKTIDGVKKARYKCYQRKEKKDLCEDIDINEVMRIL